MKVDVLNSLSEKFDKLAQTYLDENDYEMGRYYQGARDGVLQARDLITRAMERHRIED